MFDTMRLVVVVLRPRMPGHDLNRLSARFEGGLNAAKVVQFRGEDALLVNVWVTSARWAARWAAQGAVANVLNGVPFDVLEARVEPAGAAQPTIAPLLRLHRSVQPGRFSWARRLARDAGLLDRQHLIRASDPRRQSAWVGDFLDATTASVTTGDLRRMDARLGQGDQRPGGGGPETLASVMRGPRGWVVAGLLLGVVVATAWWPYRTSAQLWAALVVAWLVVGVPVGQVLDRDVSRTWLARSFLGWLALPGMFLAGVNARALRDGFDWQRLLASFLMLFLGYGWLMAVRRQEAFRIVEVSLMTLPLLIPVFLGMGSLLWRGVYEALGMPLDAMMIDWTDRLWIVAPLLRLELGFLFLLGGLYGWARYCGLPDSRRGSLSLVLGIALLMTAQFLVQSTAQVSRDVDTVLQQVRERRETTGAVGNALTWVCVTPLNKNPATLGGPPITFGTQPVVMLRSTPDRVWLVDPAGDGRAVGYLPDAVRVVRGTLSADSGAGVQRGRGTPISCR